MNMCVSTGKGDIICKSKAEIAERIKWGAALREGDELWISDGKQKYPCLSVLVKGKYACVHYFGEGEDDMWQSCGDVDRKIKFFAGGEAWEAPAHVVIPTEMALVCMEEFCDAMERPKCIRWGEL